MLRAVTSFIDNMRDSRDNSLSEQVFAQNYKPSSPYLHLQPSYHTNPANSKGNTKSSKMPIKETPTCCQRESPKTHQHWVQTLEFLLL